MKNAYTQMMEMRQTGTIDDEYMFRDGDSEVIEPREPQISSGLTHAVISEKALMEQDKKYRMEHQETMSMSLPAKK